MLVVSLVGCMYCCISVAIVCLYYVVEELLRMLLFCQFPALFGLLCALSVYVYGYSIVVCLCDGSLLFVSCRAPAHVLYVCVQFSMLCMFIQWHLY